MLRRAPAFRASRRGTAIGISTLRVGVGLAMLARPDLVPRIVGVDRLTASRLRWLGQMLGGRDLGLGVGVLASGGATSRPWLLTQALVDGVDLLALLAAARRRTAAPLPATALAVTAFATVATEIGLALAEPDPPPRVTPQS